ncbi:MAG: outer membrane protein assembly factor BamB family protein [Planctomycetota bacterium]
MLAVATVRVSAEEKTEYRWDHKPGTELALRAGEKTIWAYRFEANGGFPYVHPLATSDGGLVVVIGCDSPTLLAELRASESYLVHGLDRDPEKVAAARSYLREKGLYGSVTATRWDGPQLPYVDSLVNLVVASGECPVASDEIARVLAPNGVAVKLDPETRNLKPEAFFHKPWPEELDQWSHFLYDASNNAVSGDTEVGPPRGLRWTCGPEYSRSHEHFASMSAMVTAGGRVFYIIDEGPISSVYLPPKWKLVARDAFSGVLLWDRPITNWEAHLRGFRSGPPEIGRRLVATGDRVYVSSDYGEPVTVLDAATGKQLTTLAGTGGARELVLKDGTFYALADDMAADQHEERKKWINQVSPTLEIWYRFPRRAIPMYGTQRIAAIKTETGKLLWERRFEAPGKILPTTMAVDDGRVCLQTVSHLVCLDAVVGKELWRSERPVARSRFSWSTPTLVIHDGVVLSLDRAGSDNVGKSPPAQGTEWIISSGGFDDRQDGELVTFFLDDGKELWRAPYSENYNTPGDVFVIDGVVWVGNLRGGGDAGFTQGRDLKTGKITATIPAQKAWGHHRCYRNKATVKWLMVGRGGIQFIDPSSGAVQGNSWVRGACQYGTMPANGLVYVPQHSCACQPEELLIGLNALSPQSSAGEGPPPLEKGPAYDSGSPPSALSSQLSRDWPTYRRDARRSGYQALPAPSRPGVAWTTKLSPPITAPIAADGIMFVAETDRHTLHALSAVDGEPVWTFVADGRIDSPPTLSGGRCLFGSRSGFVYCLQASDGALVWRFRAAPQDRRVFAYEQLESVWPVHGSVLVDEIGRNRSHARQSVELESNSPWSGDRSYARQSVAYFAAGRSSRLDGGIRLYALEVKTGTLLHKADVKVPGGQGANIIRQSVLPDILSIQKNTVWMRGLGVDRNLSPVEDLPHLFAPRGFLDDTWWHRTYWVYGAAVKGGYGGWPLAGNAMPAGRLLVFDGGESIYGYGRMTYREGDGHVGPQAANGYKLFAEVLTPKPRTREDARGEKRQVPGRREIKWTSQPPFVAKSIVLTSDSLLVAGGRSLPENAEHRVPGTFWIVSRKDGSKLEQCELPSPPVLDGMALTDSGVFVSTIDGSAVCLRTKNDR